MMKSLQSLAVIFAAAALFTSCNNASKGDGKISADSLASAMGKPMATNIVYINGDSLIAKYDMAKELMADLQSKADATTKDLEARGRNLERKLADFQNKVEKALITRAQAEELGAKLQQEQYSFQQLSNKKAGELQEEQDVVAANVHETIRTFIDKYNLEKKYDLIINTSTMNNVVLAGNPALDITNEIVEGLNAEYKKKGGKKSITELDSTAVIKKK